MTESIRTICIRNSTSDNKCTQGCSFFTEGVGWWAQDDHGPCMKCTAGKHGLLHGYIIHGNEDTHFCPMFDNSVVTDPSWNEQSVDMES